MEKCDILLLNKIKQYLNKEKVNYNTNNEIISLYELYIILNEELEGLRNIKIKENSKINKKLHSFSIIHFVSERPSISNFRGDRKTCTMTLYRDQSKRELNIYKDKNVNECYFDYELKEYNKTIYKFIKKNHNLILETLQTLEYYVDILGNFDDSYFKNIEIKDSLFKIKLTINHDGNIYYKISMLNNHELFDDFNKMMNKKEGIYEFVNRNIDAIFKAIPVSVYELEEPIKSIYYIYKEKENAKVKTLKMQN